MKGVHISGLLLTCIVFIASCKNCEEKIITSRITGVEMSLPVVNADRHFDEMLFRIQVDDSVTDIRTVQTSAPDIQYAGLFGGCDEEDPWPTFENIFDSVSINSTTMYNSAVGTNLTNILASRDSKRSFTEYPIMFENGSVNELFVLSQPPAQRDTLQLILRLYKQSVPLFADTLNDVIIAP